MIDQINTVGSAGNTDSADSADSLDSLQKFLLKDLAIRGAIVSLQSSWQEVLNRRPYPPQMTELLGQATAATLLMTANIKFDGRLTLQLQSEGDLRLVVVQSDNQLAFRALAQCKPIKTNQLSTITENGIIAISLENKHEKQPYQGLVGVQADALSENIEFYFNQSEQLKTLLVLRANDQQAGGVLLQAMPQCDASEDDWQRLRYVLNTFSLRELRAIDLPTKLQRLFAEDEVVIFPESHPNFDCTCSEERTLMMLNSLSVSKLEDIIHKDTAINIACDFCGQTYRHDAATIQALLANRQHPN
ncbi:Hsp33 family molecular chaperone HslO [Ostreibacterium oceani]|uniref:Molecular chaperone Hsp33 n=1 Tax=Ostreibacterium oceani TaxID=2654998 RepID=A0A6N7EWA5_9GAMM|nr:Hsp33 family molecular chaperone HslO [Ostreibacterium oceani]MPV85865.1 hypothetical protein [Ostreibacterium oceani]